MAKTLYYILEVSSTASPDAIRAAYERLSALYDPYSPENRGKADVRMRHDAVKEAFLTLCNPEKRARYDQTLAPRPSAALGTIEVVEPFWTLPKVIVLGIVLLVGGGLYYQHKQAEARLAAERAIAEAKVREAQAKAEAEAQAAMQARIAEQQARAKERERQNQEARTRHEFERTS